MASVKLEKKFRDKYLDDLEREICKANEELENSEIDLLKAENEAYLNSLTEEKSNADRYFNEMDKHTVLVKGKTHNKDKDSYESFKEYYDLSLKNQYNELETELIKLEKQNQNRPQIQGNGSGSHLAEINKVKERMAKLEEEKEFARELNKEREEFFKSQSILGKAKRVIGEFIDSLQGRIIGAERKKEMDRRHKLVFRAGVVASQIKKDTEKLKNPSSKKSFEQIKEDFHLLIEKKEHFLELIKEVDRCDRNIFNVRKATKGQQRIIDRKERIEHETLSNHLGICIDCGDESLESISNAYQQSINEEDIEKYGNFGNKLKTWAEKVQLGSSSRMRDYVSSKQLDNRAM